MFQTTALKPGTESRIPGRKSIRCLAASRIWAVSALCLSFLASDLPAVATLELGKSGGAVPFPHSNGRQIGRNKDGLWLVAYDGKVAGGRSIFLAASRSDDPEFAGDFHSPVAVAGKSAEALISGGKGDALGASFVIDQDDVLHLIWQSSNPQGIWYSRCRVQGKAAEKIREAGNWSGAQRVDSSAQDPQLGDLALDEEGRLWVSYSQSTKAPEGHHYYLQAGGEKHSYRLRGQPAEQIWVATPSAGGWKRKPLTLPGDFRSPVLETGPPGSFDGLRAHAYGEVLHEEGKFRMWYTGLDRYQSRHHVGYAESEDGVNWVKPILNQVEYGGSKANNIVDLDYRGRGAYVPMIFKDERDPDPSRRYKALVAQRGNTLHYSPDGIHWSTVGTTNRNFGDRKNLFYDALDPKAERRWKVFSHCNPPPHDWVRMTCRYWSTDLLEWTVDPRNPILHPRAGTEVEQHLTSVWPYAGLYLGMFDIWGPDQLTPQQLIASRDGVNFVHVFDGQPVIELGKEGEWDRLGLAREPPAAGRGRTLVLLLRQRHHHRVLRGMDQRTHVHRPGHHPARRLCQFEGREGL